MTTLQVGSDQPVLPLQNVDALPLCGRRLSPRSTIVLLQPLQPQERFGEFARIIREHNEVGAVCGPRHKPLGDRIIGGSAPAGLSSILAVKSGSRLVLGSDGHFGVTEEDAANDLGETF